jgi:YHS domain-containing protein
MRRRMMVKRKEDKKIACHICKKLIPKATALHAEGEDYVLYFCNIECLDYWKDQEKEEPGKS